MSDGVETDVFVPLGTLLQSLFVSMLGTSLFDTNWFFGIWAPEGRNCTSFCIVLIVGRLGVSQNEVYRSFKQLNLPFSTASDCMGDLIMRQKSQIDSPR